MEKINFGESDAKRKIKYLANYQILEKNMSFGYADYLPLDIDNFTKIFKRFF